MKSNLHTNELEELWVLCVCVFVWQIGVYFVALAGLELIL